MAVPERGRRRASHQEVLLGVDRAGQSVDVGRSVGVLGVLGFWFCFWFCFWFGFCSVFGVVACRPVGVGSSGIGVGSVFGYVFWLCFRWVLGVQGFWFGFSAM